jgi:hypothetical protein
MKRSGGLTRLVALALPLVFGGCSTYKYFDIHVSFSPTAFNDASVGQIHHCRVTVSGADKSDFVISDCPSMSTVSPLDAGTFEYSSFATSGTMNFELDTFVGLVDKTECQSGKGSVAIPVTGATTIPGNLVVDMNVGPQPSCMPNVTPPSDGSTP